MTVTMTSHTGISYDSYDFEVEKDPHPVWKRTREAAPLYWAHAPTVWGWEQLPVLTS
jgi:hypothetical protein